MAKIDEAKALLNRAAAAAYRRPGLEAATKTSSMMKLSQTNALIRLDSRLIAQIKRINALTSLIPTNNSDEINTNWLLCNRWIIE